MPKSISAGEISVIASPHRAAILHHHRLSGHAITSEALNRATGIPEFTVVRETTILVELGFLIRDVESNATVMNVEKIQELLRLLDPGSLRELTPGREKVGAAK